MKYLITNKHWEINKEYNIEKLLYLLIDRPDYNKISPLLWEIIKRIGIENYNLPDLIYGI